MTTLLRRLLSQQVTIAAIVWAVKTASPAGATDPSCDVSAMACGSHHSLTLLSDGTIRSWGSNSNGQLGKATASDFSDTAQVVEAIGFTTAPAIAIAGGGIHSLALLADGTVWAWGSNGFGQLGQPNCPVDESFIPVQVEDPADASGYLSGVVAIAAGSHHSLAVKADGTVVGWGWNDAGQLGDGTSIDQPYPTRSGAGTLDGIVAVAAGHSFSLALTGSGEVWSWGYNADGQLGRDLLAGAIWTSAVGQVETATGNLAGVKAISGAASGNFALALLADGTAMGWGANGDGQMGVEAIPVAQRIRAAPIMVTPMASLGDLKAIAAGGRHSLGLTSEGHVWAWGANLNGQLGNVSGNDWRPEPALVVWDSDPPVTLLGGVSLIAAGSLHSASYVAGNQVQTFGTNLAGELGNPDGNGAPAPPPSEAHGGGKAGDTAVYVVHLGCPTCMPTYQSVKGGESHSVGLVGNYVIATWGGNTFGQLGTDPTGTPSSDDPLQVNLPNGEVAIAVSAGAAHTLALASDGTVYAWGRNLEGQLGVGGVGGYSDTPLRVLVDVGPIPSGTPLDQVIAIAAGGYHNLALRSDGTVWTWGLSEDGQLGNGMIGPLMLSPLAVAVGWTPANLLTGITSIAAGWRHSLAVHMDGIAYSWGDDSSEQLGDGTSLQDQSRPVAVRSGGVALQGVVELAGGGLHSLARLDDGTAMGWGEDADGQVGIPIPNPTAVAEATQVGLPVHVRAVAAGGYHSIALQGDTDPADPSSVAGLGFAWGRHDVGQLGIGGTLPGASQPQPTRVVGLGGVGELSMLKSTGLGLRHSLALAGTGFTYAWGDGADGRLGTGSPVAASSVPLPQGRTPDPLPVDQGNCLLGAKLWDQTPPTKVFLAWPNWPQVPPLPNGWWVCRNVLKTELNQCIRDGIDPQSSPHFKFRTVVEELTDDGAITQPTPLYFYRIHGASQCYHDPGP